jgi:hypothetical protein
MGLSGVMWGIGLAGRYRAAHVPQKISLTEVTGVTEENPP